MSKRKTVVVLDCETSGLSAQYDWIIQLSAIKFDKETLKETDSFNYYIRPVGKYEIHPDATAVHGLTKEFIEQHGKPISEVGPKFLEFIKDSDIMGYNSNNFDILRIYKDFTYSGLEFPIDGIQFYDVLAMERRIHPNDLSSVFARYMGKTMEDAGYKAHDSMSDVRATLDVFRCQMEFLDYESIDEWRENQLFVPDGTVRLANKPEEPDLVVFSQGKYRDRDVFDVMCTDPNYMQWAAKNLFSNYTLNKVRDYCRKKKAAANDIR